MSAYAVVEQRLVEGLGLKHRPVAGAFRPDPAGSLLNLPWQMLIEIFVAPHGWPDCTRAARPPASTCWVRPSSW